VQEDALTVISAETRAPAVALRKKYLFGPVADFLMLGGSAFVLLPFMLLMPLKYEGAVATVMLLLANVINHPHFAHSYQIFYRNFGRKITGDGYDRSLQVRYIFAGIVVPIVMAGFFAYGIAAADTRLLGYAANMLGFFVGWHYVKQGYGMIMVDAVLKKLFFKDMDKKILLWNSYIVWILSWLQVNAVIGRLNYWGLEYYTFAVPAWLIDVMGIAAIASTAATIVMLANRWRSNGGALPYNGVVAYAVSLYAWILFVSINPLWILVVPALHSLQYLAVVWRFETNIERERPDADREPQLGILSRLGPKFRLQLILFIAIGLVLGYLGFYGLPMLLDALVPYNRQVLGSTLFLFTFWIFINIHHYFLDNVMWRRGNPEVSKYLFR
jgi:hypothetical protein